MDPSNTKAYPGHVPSHRHALDWTFREFIAAVSSPWQVMQQLRKMEKKMALDAAALKAQINDATTNLAGDVRGLKAKLESALADQDVRVEAAVQEALDGFDDLATNLENLASETPEDPIVDEEPTP